EPLFPDNAKSITDCIQAAKPPPAFSTHCSSLIAFIQQPDLHRITSGSDATYKNLPNTARDCWFFIGTSCRSASVAARRRKTYAQTLERLHSTSHAIPIARENSNGKILTENSNGKILTGQVRFR